MPEKIPTVAECLAYAKRIDEYDNAFGYSPNERMILVLAAEVKRLQRAIKEKA